MKMKDFIFLFILIITLSFGKSQFIKTIQQKVVEYASQKEGSEEWQYPGDQWNIFDRGVDRMSENGKTFFCNYEPKCNLFVYEMLYKSGLELPLFNSMGKRCRAFHWNKVKERPPTNSDVVNNRVSELYLVGTQYNGGLEKAIPGDIITNGLHMGIVMGYHKAISASSHSIRYSDFDAYYNDKEAIHIYRYDDGIPKFTYSVQTKNHGVLGSVSSSSSDYAGIVGDPITGIAIKVDRCSVKYRVHIINGDWLDYVYKYDWNDPNGYAGNGKEIDLVEVNFSRCQRNPHIDLNLVPYRVSPVNKKYFNWQFGNLILKKFGFDGYAGSPGVSIDRFQIAVTR